RGSLAILVTQCVVLRICHSHPTRRSSDLARCLQFFGGVVVIRREPRSREEGTPELEHVAAVFGSVVPPHVLREDDQARIRRPEGDRKSKRLNSSHQIITYVVL